MYPPKTKHQARFEFDVIIIGSGTAGLVCALDLATELNVAIISKKHTSQGSSFYAQGGISAVLASQDSVQKHIKDTLNTAKGLANKKAVEFMVSNSKSAIKALEGYGVKFTKNNNNYHLTTEGGHQTARIVHIADKTGYAIQTHLLKCVLARKNIHLFEYHLALDLLVQNEQCYGVYALDIKAQTVSLFLAKQTVLATGGASKAYFYTSNPDTSTGDGMAMAYRATCPLIDMEFSQFHPTCLYHPQAKSFLISETLRGEGAKLVLPNGQTFMENYHRCAELAPRDIVAYAIDHEMKKLGIDYVYLDISSKSSHWIKKRFPTIYKKCLNFGIDITQHAIPVVPAAHYTCGGIKTNLVAQTKIRQLFAIGEVAHTGVHGANRMASNSLLECIVFARCCAKYINHHRTTQAKQSSPPFFQSWDDSWVRIANERIIVKHLWDEVRRVMWNFVGIVRNTERLQYAKKHLEIIQHQVENYYQNYQISVDLIELRNLVQVGHIIVRASLSRKESRGLYHNSDYPQTSQNARHSRIQKRKKRVPSDIP